MNNVEQLPLLNRLPRKSSDWPRATVEAMYRAYMANEKLQDIAERHGVGASTLGRALKRHRAQLQTAQPPVARPVPHSEERFDLLAREFAEQAVRLASLRRALGDTR